MMSCVLKKCGFTHFLKGLPEGSVDLILTNPPYAISRKTGFSSLGPRSVERFAVSMDFGAWDQSEIDLKELATSGYRALRKGGTAIVFYDMWKLTTLANALTDAGFKQLRLSEWIKTNPVPLNSKRNYLTSSREIAVLAVKHSRRGDFVIDPFVGSGTTAVAAVSQGRKFAGCDIDGDYIKTAKARVEKGALRRIVEIPGAATKTAGEMTRD